MPQHWQPGRRGRYKPTDPGKISTHKYAWVDTFLGEFMILVGDDNTGPRSPGLDVVIHKPGQYHWSLPLTKLTRSELDKTQELFDLAFRWARETVDARDKIARDAFEAGDDSISRIYRRDPRLFVRKRPDDEYSTRLRQRSEGILEGDGGEGDPPYELRTIGTVLAGDDEGQGESEDDDPKTDEP